MGNSASSAANSAVATDTTATMSQQPARLRLQPLQSSLSPQPLSPLPPSATANKKPATIADYDNRSNSTWAVSFVAAMMPFSIFCFSHARGATAKAVEAVAKSRVGVYGLLALPFCTLAMEKCIYDTVQAAQGIDPNVRPADRGGFPSGGAELPSFSLISVRKQ